MKLSLVARALSCFVMITGGCARGPAPAPGASVSPAATPAVSEQPDTTTATAPAVTCAAERKQFVTRIVRPGENRNDAPPPEPPDGKLARVKYRSPLGAMWAYVTPDPRDGKRHPAVVWAHGGFDFSIGELAFQHGPPESDQSGRGFVDAGLVVMFPSYRGNHDNPGQYEMLHGEVDDYLAALEYVRGLPYVDPARVYLAGHSTGATLVLLAAALSDKYRAAFALGPVGWIQLYGEEPPFDPESPQAQTEWRLRSPAACIGEIRGPTLIIEGENGNAGDARALGYTAQRAGVPVQVSIIEGKDHFDVIAPAVRRIAEQIAADSADAWGASEAARLAEQIRADSGREPDANEAAPAAEQTEASFEGYLDKNVIRQIMRSKLPDITLCYERVLLREPELAGTLVVTFQIQPDGKVANAQAEGVHEEVAACVAGVVAALQFPRPKGGGLVQVRYPFTFRPTGG